MSSAEEKIASRREAMMKAAALKLTQAREAEMMADFMKPDMEARIRTWIKEELFLILQTAIPSMRTELSKNLKATVKEEVSAYCKSVFDSQQDAEYVSLCPPTSPNMDYSFVGGGVTTVRIGDGTTNETSATWG